MAAVDTEFPMLPEQLPDLRLAGRLDPSPEEDPVAQLEKLFPFRYTMKDDDYRKCVEKKNRMHKVPVIKPWPPLKIDRRNRRNHRYNDIDRSDHYNDRRHGRSSDRHRRNEYSPPQYHRRYHHSQRSPAHRGGGQDYDDYNDSSYRENRHGNYQYSNGPHDEDRHGDNYHGNDRSYSDELRYTSDNLQHDDYRNEDYYHDNNRYDNDRYDNNRFDNNRHDNDHHDNLHRDINSHNGDYDHDTTSTMPIEATPILKEPNSSQSEIPLDLPNNDTNNLMDTSSNTMVPYSDIMATGSDTIGTSINTIGTSSNTIGTSSNTIGTSSNTVGTSSNTIGTSSNTIIGTSSNTIIGTSSNTMASGSNTMATIVSSIQAENSDKPPPTDSDIQAILNIASTGPTSTISLTNNSKKQKKKTSQQTNVKQQQHRKRSRQQQVSEPQQGEGVSSKKRKLSDSIMGPHGGPKVGAASILLGNHKPPPIKAKKKRIGKISDNSDEDEIIDPVILNQDTLEVGNILRQGAMQQQDTLHSSNSTGAFYHQPESLKVCISLSLVKVKAGKLRNETFKSEEPSIEISDQDNTTLSLSPHSQADNSFEYSTTRSTTRSTTTTTSDCTYSSAVTVDDSKKQVVLRICKPGITGSSMPEEDLSCSGSSGRKSHKGKKKKKKNKEQRH